MSRLAKVHAGLSLNQTTAHFGNRFVATLVRFLQQNGGVLAKRGHEKEFKMLTDKEVHKIEKTYKEIFEVE